MLRLIWSEEIKNYWFLINLLSTYHYLLLHWILETQKGMVSALKEPVVFWWERWTTQCPDSAEGEGWMGDYGNTE